jgi:hypothetical protein
MVVFDSGERDYLGPSRRSESKFEFLNRSARARPQNIRALIEAWYSHYPTDGQPELRDRMRSNRDAQFAAAFFELAMHELLLRLDCSVHLHPVLPSTSKRPDFMVQAPSGMRFILECKIVTGGSAKDAAARARVNAVYDGIDQSLKSPNFFVGIDVQGAPNTPPPIRQIAAFLQSQLDQLDPDQIAAFELAERWDEVPHWTYLHDGWHLEFFPISKLPEARGRSGVRPIGRVSSEYQVLEGSRSIRNAIDGKAGLYGTPDVPYVIAVNALEMVDTGEVLEALYGTVQTIVSYSDVDVGMREPSIREVRVPDGAWRGAAGPRNTRVSAALIAFDLSPWNLAHAEMSLFQNPWAQHPLDSVLTRLPCFRVQDNRAVRHEGETLSHILDIPASWPN